jgi:hypothetical protein
MSSYLAEIRAASATRTSAQAKRPWIRSDDVRELVEPAKNLIIKYPSAALASAFLVGVVVAWWIKRR